MTRALSPCSHWGLGRGGEGGAFRETEALPAGADLAQRKAPGQSAFSGTPGGDVERCPLRVRTETTPCPAIHWDPPKDR